MRILTILGPTASGKTSLAIKIAKLLDGEIISLDSRQIYKGMEIGTAQPTEIELSMIPHHLIGFRSPEYSIAAGEYADLVTSKIKEVKMKEKIPIICGGAGLYYRALDKGIFRGSISDLKVRERIEREYDYNSEILYQKLEKIDPEYFRIVHINNKKRLVRALEIFEITGKVPSEHFKKQQKGQKKELDLFTIFLEWERQALIDRIEDRTKNMLNNGWIDEVKTLLQEQSNMNVSYTALNSIGYSQIKEYLAGKIGYIEMEEDIIIKTRQFSRKQTQWFSKESINLIIEMGNMLDENISLIISELYQNIKR